MPPVSVIDTWPDLQGVAGRVYHERTGRSLHEAASRILEGRDARTRGKTKAKAGRKKPRNEAKSTARKAPSKKRT